MSDTMALPQEPLVTPVAPPGSFQPESVTAPEPTGEAQTVVIESVENTEQELLGIDSEFTELQGMDLTGLEPEAITSRNNRLTELTTLKAEKTNKLISQLEQRISYEESQIASLTQMKADIEKEHMHEGRFALETEIEFLNKSLDKLSEIESEVAAEVGKGVTNLQQLQYTAGSTLVATSSALSMLREQRDVLFANGMSGMYTMGSQIIAADEQAEFSSQQAREYMQLANMQKQKAQLDFLFQGLGLVAGIGMSAAGIPGGLAIGSLGGSFLANAFSR